MENHFVIRSYGFGELAQLYNPFISKKAATYRLKCWIQESPELVKKLKLKPYTRILKPWQSKLIVKHLDIPQTEFDEFE